MDFRGALNQTFDRYHLKAIDVANKSGIPQAEISRFRTGKKDFTTDTLYQLMQGLEDKHRSTMLALMMIGD
jgi:predicted transcriptional regulator